MPKRNVKAQASQTPPPPPAARWPYAATGVVLVALVAMYFTGIISESLAGVIIASAVALAAGLYVAAAFMQQAEGIVRPLAVVAAVAVAGLVVAPIAVTVFPGTPAAESKLHAKGDSIPLPADLSGKVRVLVHAPLGGNGASRVDFELDAGDTPMKGHLERTTQTASVGRRGRTTTEHETNVDFISGVVGGSAHKLTLTNLEGPAMGGLDVSVYPDRLPWVAAVMAALAVLAFVAVLAARARLSTGLVAAAGAAVCYGLAGHTLLTPNTVLIPTVGALIVGGIGGVAVGGVLASTARPLFGPTIKRQGAKSAASEGKGHKGDDKGAAGAAAKA